MKFWFFKKFQIIMNIQKLRKFVLTDTTINLSKFHTMMDS